MGKLKISVHPLFFLFGIYFAATGKVFSFLVFTLCALIHETAHSIAAERRGYRLDRVTLMPYGALISGDLEDMGIKDELAVVAAGPAINLAVYLAIVASWWLFPETYPYTELAATANLGIFLINLIPAYPLDGGRTLLCALSLVLKRKTAYFISRTVGVIFSLALVGVFVYSCFSTPNITILFFAAFAFFGAIGKNPDNSYVRIIKNADLSQLKKCRKIVTLAVGEDEKVRDLYKMIGDENLYRLFVYDKRGKIKRVIEPDEIYGILSEKSPAETIA